MTTALKSATDAGFTSPDLLSNPFMNFIDMRLCTPVLLLYDDMRGLYPAGSAEGRVRPLALLDLFKITPPFGLGAPPYHYCHRYGK
jgi:hypothetical protein